MTVYRKALAPLTGALLLGLSYTSGAVNQSTVFGLWDIGNDAIAQQVSGIQASISFPGIETPAFLRKTNYLPVGSGLVQIQQQTRAEFTTTTGVLIGRFTVAATSPPMPDPRTASPDIRFYNGDGTLIGTGGSPVFANPHVFDGPMGVGAGTQGQGSVIVLATSVLSSYQVGAGPVVNTGRYSVSAYQTVPTLQLTWTQQFEAKDPSGMELSRPLSAVGDFLNGDLIDEARVVFRKRTVTGAKIFEYRYFNLLTGNRIVGPNNFVTVPPL